MAKGKGGFIGQDGLNAPDAPTGVSGTAGDTQVTVSWTAPSDVGGSAITGYSVVADDGSNASYVLASSSYDNKSLDVSSQEASPAGVFFKPDGLSVYMCGTATADSVFQYTLTSAWDVSTGSYASKTFDFSSQDTFPMGIFFKPDGTKMYMAGLLNNAIFQYSLSTAWDVSTASYDSTSYSLGSIGVRDVTFKPDGTKMYALGSAGDDALYQYSLSAAWDLSTASYDSVTLPDLNDQEPTAVEGAAFNYDGTRVYIIGQGNDTVYQYNLTTGYDLSTGSYSGNSFSAQSQASSAKGIYLRSDSKKFYIVDSGADAIFQYSLPEYPTTSPVTITGLTNGTSYTFNVWAINAFGWSSPSDASGSVSPVAPIGAFSLGNDSTGTPINVINKITISSTGNASDFGDLLTNKNTEKASLSSATRAIFLGGQGPAGGSDKTDVIEYKEFSSSGNTVDFGDMSDGAAQSFCGSGSDTRGLFGLPNTSTVEYITYASTGNSTTFGDYTVMTYCNRNTAVSSNTRVVFCGNSDPGEDEIMEYFTIASTGNGTDFGDLSVPVGAPSKGQMSSGTRGIIAGGIDGGGSYVNTIQYITIASTGDSTDFGDISTTAQTGGACSSTSRGVFTLGLASGGGAVNTIEYITIGSTGNSADFGDLTQIAYYSAGCSNAHGGLQ